MKLAPLGNDRDPAVAAVIEYVRWLRGSADELIVAAGLAAVVVGVALLSIAAAFMTAGVALALFGVGRIAFQVRSKQ